MSAPDVDTTKSDAPLLDLPPKVREYYNTLRDRLMLSAESLSRPPRLLAVTSCYSGEGSSTVAANLAVTLSHHGTVLLADANIGNPAVHRIFKISLSPGLAESLVTMDSQSVSRMALNLDVLTAGQLNGIAPKKFESPHIVNELLSQFKRQYEFVIIDAPAVNETSAALRIGSLADGVVLVVEAEKTRWETVERVKNQLEQVNAKVLGVVLNKRRYPIPRFFYRR